jgi:hypothetical protein
MAINKQTVADYFPALQYGAPTSHSLALYNPTPFNEVNLQLVHELGEDSAGHTQETCTIIDASKFPTKVSVRLDIVGKTKPSPAYMATVRRRKAAVLCNLVRNLKQYVARDDFHVYTYPLFEGLRELLNTLADAELEGRAREVLRQLRDSLLNKGWEGYRGLEAQRVVGDLLAWLSQAEEVENDKVKAVSGQLRQVGLNPLALELPDLWEGEEGDGE